MTREEAIARIREAMPTLWKGTKDAIQTLLPELAESEDERIRKEIIDFVNHYRHNTDLTVEQAEWCKKALAWLEKQKVNTEGDFGRGYDCGYQAGYAVAMNEMKPKVATAALDSEKRKEQKPAEWSEEDEEMRQSIIKDIEFERNYTSATTGKVIGKYNEQIAWLESLRPPQYCENCKLKRSVENWKPSYEQMEALNEACVLKQVLLRRDILESLYNDLKKL